MNRLKHGQVILGTLEVAEGVAEQRDTVQRRLGQAKLPGVGFSKRDVQPGFRCPSLGKAHEIAGAVDANDAGEASPCQFNAMAALSAAQVENGTVRRKRHRFQKKVDVLGGILLALNNVAIGLEIDE